MPDRVALYSFALVPDARPNQRRLPLDGLPAGRGKLDLFLYARSTLQSAGYAAIGMDHFALPKDELVRAANAGTLHRNFQGYTVKSSPVVVALGASSISDLGDAYAQNFRSLPQYRAAIREGKLGTHRGMWLSEDDHRRREIIMRLMCDGTVDLGDEARSRYAREMAELATMESDGLVTVQGSRITLSTLGGVFSRAVASVFDVYVQSQRATRATADSNRMSRTI